MPSARAAARSGLHPGRGRSAGDEGEHRDDDLRRVVDHHGSPARDLHQLAEGRPDDRLRLKGAAPGDYEKDHLIALELGGDPRNPKNLWPEARISIGGGAEHEDSLEVRLHTRVCSGAMTLAQAQQCIFTVP